jgi:minor extracellular serine protease Vpr
LRRLAVLLTLAAGLSASVTAAASTAPAFRSVGAVPLAPSVDGVTIPRVRPGTIRIPPGHARGLVTVIVKLPLPAVAVAQAQARVATDRLDLTEGSSRAYLARIEAEQHAAVARLRQAVPRARVTYRYQVIVNALAVRLPAQDLPTLLRQTFVARVYPSVAYRVQLNESPSIIGADVLQATRGARGDGIKIGVVDDGVDSTNPFFNPAGYQYPAGFPRGQTQFTTPKVIVARAFPGPGSGRQGQLALDRQSSFHGTHVAGIAAGDAGTNAPAGRDHPPVAGLSGVAPRAWIGNYRVFNTPTPIGYSATSGQIVAAFEAAVKDGMDVINFSGGAAELEPASDVIMESVRGTVAAGVVVVISAGNDRGDFGLGSVGTPGTAPEAITVAAVSNTHVFSQALTVTSPAVPNGLMQIPFHASSNATPPAWVTADQQLVDVGTITGTNGRAVDRLLCGPASNPNKPTSTLRSGSLTRAIVLVSRGTCSFFSKSQRAKAAGAAGIIFVNNRPGEGIPVPVQLVIPGGMVADLDGERLRAAMQASGGRAQVKVGVDPAQIETARSGVPAYFSSGGPTSYRHKLKPDIAAPGMHILSSTLPEFAGSPFASFDGTSMAAPHISGSAALLRQRHPGWTPQQVKSALMQTARAASGDTARSAEAPVLLEGAGLAYLPSADDPMIFADPASISFDDANANRGALEQSALVQVSDAGSGAGAWSATVQPQSATKGVSIEASGQIAVSPGGTASLSVSARVAADAQEGEQYGFIVLTRGADVRRIPYFLLVSRPKLESMRTVRLKRLQTGTTAKGQSRAGIYRYPSTPFGPAPNFIGAPMNEDGAETMYVTTVTGKVANIGVAVLTESPGAVVDPWFLGSKDENDVLGYTGTPVNVNNYMVDFRVDVGAAGQQYPQPGTYYIAIDSGRERLTNKRLAGSYILRSWVNDVRPPRASLVTTRVSAGRPLIVLRAVDQLAGVDPFSIILSYRRVLVAAAAFDPITGLAFVPLPPAAPALAKGRTPVTMVASDYQETKNLDQAGAEPLPNTAFKQARLTVVNAPTVTWLAPEVSACTNGRLLVAAGSTRKLRSVRFFDGERRIAIVKRGAVGLYSFNWKAGRATKGRHVLRAEAADAAGRTASARRVVRIC